MSGFDPTAPHPDEAALARLDADMASSLDAYGPDGPTAADILGDEEIAHLETLDEVAGPPAAVGSGDGLWRGHTPRPRPLGLFTAADEAGLVPLGWDTWRDTPVLWDHRTGHLAVHTNRPDRADEGAQAAIGVALHLVRRYGPQALTLVDAAPTPADTARRYWAPLANAGVEVHPLAADLGRAVGALAAVAGAALARPLHPTADEDPRYLVVLHADRLVPALEAAGAGGYAAAARDTLRIIRHGGARRRVHLVASHLGDPVRTRDPLASLSAPDGGDWSYMAQYTDVPAEILAGPPSPRVILPGYVAPAWWAAHLADRP